MVYWVKAVFFLRATGAATPNFLKNVLRASPRRMDMRVTILALGALLAVSAVPAQAGSCSSSAHCYSQESGVHVFRGQHAPVISQAAFQRQARLEQEARAARELAAVNRLRATVEQQTAEIAALRNQVNQAQRPAPRRRRNVFFGNPRFFGPNGFVGNSNFSGIAVPLPRGPRRRGRSGPRSGRK